MKRFIFLVIGCVGLMAMEREGCGERRANLVDDPESESSNEQSETVTQEAALMGSLMEVEGDPADDDALAEAASEGTTNQWGTGCVTPAINGNVVTYTFDNCTGQWGFIVIAGDVDVTYTLLEPGKIQAVGVGNGLTVNDIPTDFESTVIRTVDGEKRTLEVTTEWNGQTKRGDATSRTGDYTAVLDWENECVGADGTWETKVGTIAWTTVVSNFNVCNGECPADGGSISWEGKNKTTTVTYDGTDVAAWSNTNDQSGTLNLQCGS